MYFGELALLRGEAWKPYKPESLLRWAQEISRLTPTMYFGELALLRGEARAATVLAAGDCDLLALERAEFMRVMGPLAAQLEQQAAKYAGITSAKQARW